MYNDTITLFNRYIDSMGNTMWFPHVLSGVNLTIDRSVIVKKYGEQSNDNVVCNVKSVIKDDGSIYVNDMPYLLPKEWEKQTNDLLGQSITFASGNEFDFFMQGDYGSEEMVLDSDDTFYRQMQKEYDNVFAITSVSSYTVIPHFEILGK